MDTTETKRVTKKTSAAKTTKSTKSATAAKTSKATKTAAAAKTGKTTKAAAKTASTSPTETVVTQQRFFPTVVYRAIVGNAESLNESLLEAIYEERESDKEGIQRSNYKALGGWHSKNHLYKSPKYARLVKEIFNVTEIMSDELGYDRNRCLKIGTMWSIINPPGCVNRSHIHPGCNWSGVYYVNAPEDSGDIIFTDPRTEAIMNQVQYAPGKKRPQPVWNKVNIKPVAGKMLIFPSWLFHSVEINKSELEGRDSERVIISFNMTQHKR